jgi:hypothetical protein
LFEITKFWFCDRRHFLIVESRAWRWKKITKTGRSCERSRSVKKKGSERNVGKQKEEVKWEKTKARGGARLKRKRIIEMLR